jgi:hypothetical protein
MLLRPDHGGAAANDGSLKMLEEMWLTHTLANKMLTLQIGKQLPNAGSVENIIYTDFDHYLKSDFSKYLPDYTVGVTAKLNMGEHTLALQALQGVQTEGKVATDEKGSDGGITTTLAYMGNIAGGMVKPVISFAMVRYAQDNEEVGGTVYDHDKKGATIFGIGTQMNVADIGVDVEYDTYTADKVKVAGNTADKAESGNAIILGAKYNIAAIGLAPWVKMTKETKKDMLAIDGANSDITKYGLGAELAAAANLKYFVAYNMTHWENKASSAADEKSKVDGTHLIFGASASL